MYGVFKTVLIMSLFGLCAGVVLLAVKPFTAKKLPAVWQYCAWCTVLVLMVVPIYKLIPSIEARKIAALPQNTQTTAELPQKQTAAGGGTVGTDDTKMPDEPVQTKIPEKRSIRWFELAVYVWLGGTVIFLTIIAASYFVYIHRKRKCAVAVSDCEMLEDVRRELNIKRSIRIKMSADTVSPMLVGVFFPTVFLPCRKIPEENMRMVLLHELTHCKRRDLAVKWFGVFVNAVHWFNPAAYLICANLSEACEMSCDAEVTKNMSDEEKKLYMKTMLDLIEEKRRKNV